MKIPIEDMPSLLACGQVCTCGHLRAMHLDKKTFDQYLQDFVWHKNSSLCDARKCPCCKFIWANSVWSKR